MLSCGSRISRFRSDSPRPERRREPRNTPNTRKGGPWTSPLVARLACSAVPLEYHSMSEILFKDESYRIVGACFEVYREKGCGFLEAVYQECLQIELRLQGVPFAESVHVTSRRPLWRFAGSTVASLILVAPNTSV